MRGVLVVDKERRGGRVDDGRVVYRSGLPSFLPGARRASVCLGGILVGREAVGVGLGEVREVRVVLVRLEDERGDVFERVERRHALNLGEGRDGFDRNVGLGCLLGGFEAASLPVGGVVVAAEFREGLGGLGGGRRDGRRAVVLERGRGRLARAGKRFIVVVAALAVVELDDLEEEPARGLSLARVAVRQRAADRGRPRLAVADHELLVRESSFRRARRLVRLGGPEVARRRPRRRELGVVLGALLHLLLLLLQRGSADVSGVLSKNRRVDASPFTV
mmetsp:Transcript_8035/g.24756  ORF Transcript_8035/g.24756 Transcript_8035/m.24756 type:complete len:277 (+) Transcript_8035:156-986(+)